MVGLTANYEILLTNLNLGASFILPVVCSYNLLPEVRIYKTWPCWRVVNMQQGRKCFIWRNHCTDQCNNYAELSLKEDKTIPCSLLLAYGGTPSKLGFLVIKYSYSHANQLEDSRNDWKHSYSGDRYAISHPCHIHSTNFSDRQSVQPYPQEVLYRKLAHWQ